MAVALPPSVLPDISPSRGEITRGANFYSRLASPVAEMKRQAFRLSISLLEGEMSGRTEGGKRHAPRGQTHAH
ncbi:hypothetical protein L907_25660 [Agrobacterium sp. C13]|nr:hypothetical protein K538_25665 [Agrobacterium tumefaciens GW4]KVK45219.1 hypothetical protein L904_26035 [Agrobacterium sp. LY4]KVK45289.1 hypothetical protein L903_26130 [Agrobacterium sp. JL28]KVK58875.1 hypothetical protein L906_26045 [Agrobacterium sp. TS45]KVK62878.1 hypothetical protein L907_25660 [Agrobacterium sp. C13]